MKNYLAIGYLCGLLSVEGIKIGNVYNDVTDEQHQQELLDQNVLYMTDL